MQTNALQGKQPAGEPQKTEIERSNFITAKWKFSCRAPTNVLYLEIATGLTFKTGGGRQKSPNVS